MPHTRLFRFIVEADINALPEAIKNAFSPNPTGYFFQYTVDSPDDASPDHFADDWERVPDVLGIMDFPLSTVERSHFSIIVSVLPNSKGDPEDPAWEPIIRVSGMPTDDFAPVKATDASDLVKKFPHGAFILRIQLKAVNIRIVELNGTMTFEALIADAKIRPEDIAYHAFTPFKDPSGNVIGTKHDLVYWATNLHLSGQKYVP